MTREEAIIDIRDNIKPIVVDCVSRQAVLDLIADYDLSMGQVVRGIHDLPPVTPKQRTGKWIKSRDSYGNNHFTCPFCEHDIATKYDGTWEDNFCPNCGAKMVEPQESKDEQGENDSTGTAAEDKR